MRYSTDNAARQATAVELHVMHPEPGWLVWDGRHGRDMVSVIVQVEGASLEALEADGTCWVQRWLTGRLALCEGDGTARIIAR